VPGLTRRASEIRALQGSGHTAIGFGNPLRDLAGDAVYLAEFLTTIRGPIVLVGHSYGGNVISTAAIGNDQVRGARLFQRLDVRRWREPAATPREVRRQLPVRALGGSQNEEAGASAPTSYRESRGSIANSVRSHIDGQNVPGKLKNRNVPSSGTVVTVTVTLEY
jgi:pimeloyl-ACP methyl ester carboxylesterase